MALGVSYNHTHSVCKEDKVWIVEKVITAKMNARKCVNCYKTFILLQVIITKREKKDNTNM